MGALFTIGYEGRQLDELIAELSAHRVDRVIDVRQLPLSRRRGFSKTPLGVELAEVDIEYVHLRQAGNPYRHDDIPRAELLAKYGRHLTGTRTVVTDVAESARGHRACLLCYERSADECHRSVLAKRIARRLGVSAVDL